MMTIRTGGIPLLLLFSCALLPAAAGSQQGLESDDTGYPAFSFRIHEKALQEHCYPAGPSVPLKNRDRSIFSLPIRSEEIPHLHDYLIWYESEAGKAALEQALKRGAIFLDHIRLCIEEAELPPELLWLPLIESSFRVDAVSRSGAAGLWQFMMNSIAPYPIRVNTWIDERRDFWKSTDAALHKLEYNYQILGDWLLALGAYNCGLGRMSRALKESGLHTFAELSDGGWLPAETIHYVPRFLAAAAILSRPRSRELPTSWKEPFLWDRIAPAGQVSITLLAKESGIDPDILKRGNGELFYHITPPEDGAYRLKIPRESADRVRRILSSESNDDLMKYTIHRVGTGDTLYGLSRQFGVTVDMILAVNPGIIPERLLLGTELLIPGGETEVSCTPPTRDIQLAGTHTVEPGESLWSIARTYGTIPEIIAAGNGIRIDDTLFPGRTLKVPSGEEQEQ